MIDDAVFRARRRSFWPQLHRRRDAVVAFSCPERRRRDVAALGFPAAGGYHPRPRDYARKNSKADPMSDTPPDRLATNPDSPFYNAELLERGVGIRFKGVEKTNVDEYCVSEGWVRVTAGKTMDRKGNPMTIKLQGEVVPYFRDIAES